MSSLTIAELTDKDHFHVMRDVRSMLEDLGGAIESKFGGYYKAANGKQNPCFNLPRREVDILLTGYSVPLRAKVIDRWRVLEAQAAKPVANLNDPASLRGLLLGYTEQVLQLEHKIEVDKPKVEFFDNFANKEELDTVEVLAKSLGTGRNRLFSYMRSHNILIGGTGDNKNMPYQKYIDSGRLKVKWNNYTVPETGEVKVRPSPLFTGKGAIWIREFIEENGRAGL
jgi:phage antirepressor YoqD-like protein